MANLHLNENQVIFVNDIKGNAIEDIFSKEDFFQYVLSEPLQKDIGLKNSKIINEKNYSKVLLAKNFLSKVESNGVTLEDISINNIESLLEKLNVGLGLENKVVSI